jgi:predicted RNA binding protein YcfA (HicA-like mRNA interferase family)
MKLPREVDSVQLVNALSRLGYRIVRQSGSHIRLQCDHPLHALTVPNHNPIKIGTLSAILSDVADHHQLEKAELISRLFG